LRIKCKEGEIVVSGMDGNSAVQKYSIVKFDRMENFGYGNHHGFEMLLLKSDGIIKRYVRYNWTWIDSFEDKWQRSQLAACFRYSLYSGTRRVIDIAGIA
jgi:hypothetical protein